LRYVLDTGGETATPWHAGGPVLLLQRGQPTDVNIVNHLAQNTAVHWHGLELESWSDGVAGWSGASSHVAPAIAPADSFVAHLSVPRAGTFIYHTHLGDEQQLSGGLYGALLVLPEGQAFDPTVDHVFVSGTAGTILESGFVVNGDRLESAPLVLRSGVAHRMRFVGITANLTTTWTLMRDSTVATWTALAKDGADFQPALQRDVPARMLTAVGETRDFLFTPPSPGEYVLRATIGLAAKWQQRLIVRP
jgi:FtsP/CotA-like multicopper oxidase with cupredoxin domain